jgi:glycosyltransferase involved in cell wall biosynthesis
MMKVSIIVPALNEERYIGQCLESIKKQTYKNYEIIVVNSGKDNTAKIARRYTKKVINRKTNGPAAARNIGAKAARGDILVFADADVRFGRDFLKRIVKKFNKDLGGAIFMLKFYDAKNKTFSLLYNFCNKFAWFLIKCGLIVTSGSCFVYSKKAFDEVGGFNEALVTCEDHDLARRVSRVGRFDVFSDITVFTSSRRLNREGVRKLFLLNLKSSLFYILNHRGLPEYWSHKST